MITILNTTLGESRNVARIWIEGQQLTHAGVKIGALYGIKVRPADERIELCEVDSSYTGQTFTVSKRERNGVVHPLFEVRSNVLREVFEKVNCIRVAIRNGQIVLTANHIVTQVRERVRRLLDKLRRNVAIGVCSLFHGGGVKDKALHDGLRRAGVNSFVQVAVEQDSRYINASLRNNPELWTPESVVICSDIRHVNWRNALSCELLAAGIPCTGASRSGRAKNRTTVAEEHPDAGTLFIDFIDGIKATNPAIASLECVPEYLNTAGMMVIRSVLKGLGYRLHEHVLHGNDFGVLERRERMVMIAVTEGLPDTFDFAALLPFRTKEATINDIREDVPLDSPRWKPFDYLADKELRDKAAGKGFARQLLTGAEDGYGTIGRGYAKFRSTEPFLIHPENPALSRTLTPLEHVTGKGIPPELIAGESDSVAHEIAGQSVVYPKFVSVFFEVGKLMLSAIGETVGRVSSCRPALAAA